MALLLLAEHATVTIAHSRTRDLGAVVREADVARRRGRPRGRWSRPTMVKPGATVIDVGINRVDGKRRRRRRARRAPRSRGS